MDKLARAFTGISVSLVVSLAASGNIQAQTSATAAVTDPSPAIISAPQAIPRYTGPTPHTITELGAVKEKGLNNAIQSLNENLGILYNINTATNQQTLDRLGKNYGNIPALGTHFHDAVAAIDIHLLHDNSALFAKNADTTLNAFSDLPRYIAMELSEAYVSYFKSTGYNGTTNPPPASELPHIQALLQENKEKTRPVVTGVGRQDLYISKMVNKLAVLNSNIISINQTYLNLLKVSEEKPSVLVTMPNLSSTLASLDNLANTQLKGLSSLNSSMAAINAIYDTINHNAGEEATPDQNRAEIAARLALTEQLQGLDWHLTQINSGMAQTLGHVPQNTPGLYGAPTPQPGYASSGKH